MELECLSTVPVALMGQSVEYIEYSERRKKKTEDGFLNKAMEEKNKHINIFIQRYDIL